MECGDQGSTPQGVLGTTELQDNFFTSLYSSSFRDTLASHIASLKWEKFCIYLERAGVRVRILNHLQYTGHEKD